ncbi:hypothetical protein AAFF39_01655 [Lactococcus garvieae]
MKNILHKYLKLFCAFLLVITSLFSNTNRIFADEVGSGLAINAVGNFLNRPTNTAMFTSNMY